jgi:alpha-beta hydrolase superfamily lysophospholipase
MTYNHSEYMKGWRARRKAAGLPTGGKASSKWWAKYRSEYYADPKNRARIAANMARYRKDPSLRVKHEARWAVNRAIAAGRLVRQPCACGNQKTQAHHHDYAKPLDVRWLCGPCHRKEHAKAEGR